MMLQYKRQIGIAAIALAPLLIPLIAMFFTNEVNWTVPDFVIGALLLLSSALLIDFVARRTGLKYKVGLIVIIIVALLLVWAELAVGIIT